MRDLTVGSRWVCLLLALCGWLSPVWAAPEHNDVRVLIDISGSMKQNDPQNLRRPALRMLVGLMQPETRAAVWTFAKWSNPLVPLADVDEAWKKRAVGAAGQISSPGAFTHIERVIENATADWQGEPTTHRRHLVLLTDGMVDVSKDVQESAQSRQRIIDTWLPKLKALNVHVHTIALSERADHALMQQLSSSTDGRYQQVDSADKLQRTFLKIFEQVGKPDTVPLNDNKFIVDSSVREATVLLFRKPGDEAPVLISPSGEEFTDSDLPAGIAWFRDEGYELVTIASPAKGEWGLRADVDPDNRVMIVTDLKLKVSEVPAHIALGEPLLVSAHLTARGKLVQRKAFLRLLDVQSEALMADGSEQVQDLNDLGQGADDKPGDGRYRMQYAAQQAHDDVELLIAVESPTFMREKRMRLQVHEPASLQVIEEAGELRAQIKLDEAVLQPGSKVFLWQRDASGARVDLSPLENKGDYAIADPAAAVFADVSAKTQLGFALTREYGPVYPPGASAKAVTEPQAEPEPEKALVEPVTPAEEQAPEGSAETHEEEASSWLMPALIFGGVNLLLIGGGLAAWMIIRKRRQGADDTDLLEEESEPAPDGEIVDAEIVEDEASSGGKGEAA